MYLYHPSHEELVAYKLKLDTERASGKIIVFTNGCFDLLHKGHVYSLEKCREHGTYVIVGLNSNESVRRLKGPTRPIEDELVRRNKLSSLNLIDDIITYHEDTPLRLLKYIRPDVLLKGGDYIDKEVVGVNYASRTIIIDRLPGLSTTEIINNNRGFANEEI